MAWARKLPSGRWQSQWRDSSGNVRSAGSYRRKSEAVDAGQVQSDAVAPVWASITTGARWCSSSTRPTTCRALSGSARRRGRCTRCSYVGTDGVLEWNVARKVAAPKAEPKPIRVLESQEVERIAAAIEPRYRALVLVGAWAGLRFGEAAALRVGRLRLVERRVDVAEALTEVGGKVAFGPLKTSQSRRTVTVPAFLAEEIAQHVQQYVQHGPDSLVFTAPEGGPIHRSWRQRFWLPAVRRAGVEPPPTFHHLRHHAAAVAIAAGAHPKAIQARLGHSNVTVTLGTYGHLLPGLDDDLAHRLDEARSVAAADSAARLLHENVVPIRKAT